MEELLGAFVRITLGVLRFVGELALHWFVEESCTSKKKGWKYTCAIIFLLFLAGIASVIYLTVLQDRL